MSIFYKTAVISVILLSFGPAISVDGQTPQSLTLDDCINSARKNNETVKIQSQKITQSEQKILRASGDILPNLSFLYQKFYKNYAESTVSEEGTDSRFFVAQPLYYGSRKKKTIELSKSDKYIAELQLQDVTRKLDSDVALAFYTLMQFESDLKNTNETVDKMTDRKNELKERVRLGKSRESELYMLESQIALLRSDVQNIFGKYTKSLETLSFLTGISASAVKISDILPEPQSVGPIEKIIESAISRSDIQAANESVAEQYLRVRIAKGEYLPTFDLNSSWYTTRSGSTSGSDWDVYLLLNMPLFQGGRIKSRVNEELSKLQEYKDFLSLTMRKLKTEIRQLHTSLESSVAQVSALKDAYNKAQKSYDLQVEDYRLGLVNNLDVIQATLTLLYVKSNLDRVVLQAKLNKILLDISVR
ncbi:MAG: TolC family protein [Elusimicrobiota bacterium]|nr:TolC family protein [Elusimicrobiota bacterium]